MNLKTWQFKIKLISLVINLKDWGSKNRDHKTIFCNNVCMEVNVEHHKNDSLMLL